MTTAADRKAIARAQLHSLEPMVSATMEALMAAAGSTDEWTTAALLPLARRAVALEAERRRLYRIAR
jgi:hypothetical protein